MQAVLSQSGASRWRVAIIAGVIAPLALTTLPGAPLRMLARGVSAAVTVSNADRIDVPCARTASEEAIDAVLGLLQTRDEALLREPLLGMRATEDPGVVARWGEVFSTRLDGMTIPAGTRANLAMTFAAYEREVLARLRT